MTTKKKPSNGKNKRIKALEELYANESRYTQNLMVELERERRKVYNLFEENTDIRREYNKRIAELSRMLSGNEGEEGDE
jgi:hypothetical protein